MLKRYQVLLNDWLADYIKAMSDEFDVSFSECLRIAACIFYGQVIALQNPEYKHKMMFVEDAAKRMKEYAPSSAYEEIKHKDFSDIYFEARKAIEYEIKKHEKKKKK